MKANNGKPELKHWNIFAAAVKGAL